MTEYNRYALMLEAYAELKPEIELSRQAQPVPALPSLSEVLAEFGAMPNEALFLGVATDGLPVLLNLHDPVPGPLLITGESGSGKTAFLRMVIHAAAKMHQPEELQFGVLTSHPDEWSGLTDIPNNVGVFPYYDKSSDDFILSLASWAHSNKTSSQSVLLLLDGLEAIEKLDDDTVQNLRWLLLRGPARRVWPIVTLNSQHMASMTPWLDAFRSRILGKMEDAKSIRRLNSEQADPATLVPGSEFVMREGDHWLRFWMPSID